MDLPADDQRALAALQVFPSHFSVFAAAYVLGEDPSIDGFPQHVAQQMIQHDGGEHEKGASASSSPGVAAAAERARARLTRLVEAGLIEGPSVPPPKHGDAPRPPLPPDSERAWKLTPAARKTEVAWGPPPGSTIFSLPVDLYKDFFLNVLTAWSVCYTEAGSMTALQLTMMHGADVAEVRLFLACPVTVRLACPVTLAQLFVIS